MLPEAQKASLYRTDSRAPVQKTNVRKQKRGQKRKALLWTEKKRADTRLKGQSLI